MFWLLLVGVYIAFVYMIYRKKDEHTRDFIKIYSFFVFCALLFVSIGFSHYMGVSYEKKTFSQKINSLNDMSKVEGNFFLGTGTVEEKSYYYFYKNNNDELNSFSRDKVAVSKTLIIEDNTQHPKHEWDRAIIVDTNFWFIHPFLLSIHEKLIGHAGVNIFKEQLNPPTNHKLIVPEGTVIKEFKLE